MRHLLSFSLLILLVVCTPPYVAAQRGGKKHTTPDLGVSDNPADFGIRSKKALKLYRDGLVQQTYGRYGDARGYYAEALEIEPQFGMVHFRIGEIRYILAKRNNQSIQEALEPFLTAEKLHPEGRPDMWQINFYLAEIFAEQGAYDRAELYLKRFLQGQNLSQGYEEKAQQMLPSVQFAAEAMRNPVPFNPQNLGPAINSTGDDYMAYLTADDQLIFFTTRREGVMGGFDPGIQNYPEDFFVSEKRNGEWQPAVNLGPPVNTYNNEGAPCISPDGQYVIFTACGRREGYGGCDLYVAKLNGTQWTEPASLGPVINSRGWDSHPNLSNDGRTLYFASDRPGGYGGVDLWQSTYDEQLGWSQPTNMGPTINTPAHEYSPFLHADDHTFYFSSEGHLGFGGRDLFMSTRADTGWTTPKNLGYPINTGGNEQNLFVNAAGTIGVFSSNKLEGLGKNDLYTFEMPPGIRPQRRATFVRGIVLDSVTRKAIGAEVTLVRLSQATADTTRRITSNTATGKFLTSLPLGEDYAAFVDASGYLFYSQNFSLKDLGNEQYFDLAIALQPIKTGATVVLRNIFFAYNSHELLPESEAELQNAVRFLNRNPSVRVEIGGHTDDVGSEAFNQNLSERRAGTVRDYLTRHGIAPDRLTAKGYGKSQPLAPNDSDAHRAMNRRTAFTILQK